MGALAVHQGLRSRGIVALCAVGMLLVGTAAGAGADSEVCMECHADPELQRESAYRTGTSVYVDGEVLAGSMHEGMECQECHAEASDEHPEQLPPASCADCHDDVAEDYVGSLHGAALKQGIPDAPSCADCHGDHGILPAADPNSMSHPNRVPGTCAVCHADVDFIDRRPVSLGSPLEGYQESVHFQALERGVHGATCVD